MKSKPLFHAGLNRRGLSLSRIVTLVREHLNTCHAMHEDVDVMYAPHECHRKVAAGNRLDRRELERRIGMPMEAVWSKVVSRTSHKWAYNYLHFMDTGRCGGREIHQY